MIVDNCGEVMSISRTQMGCLLLILLSTSVLKHEVLGARYVQEMEHVLNYSPVVWRKSFGNETDDGGSFDTVNREVPSSPDPLHNR